MPAVGAIQSLLFPFPLAGAGFLPVLFPLTGRRICGDPFAQPHAASLGVIKRVKERVGREDQNLSPMEVACSETSQFQR